MNRFKVRVEKDGGGSYIAYNTNGDKYTLIGRGGTVEAARADFVASMRGVAEVKRELWGKCSEVLTNEPEFVPDVL